MTIHLHKELSKMKNKILSLGTLVEERVRSAVRAVETHDMAIASHLADTDHEIDDMEVEVEEECLKIMALYQPVASDLRFLVVVIKINNDLERIGDLAANIARRIETISKRNAVELPFDYAKMGAIVQEMLKGSLDAFVGQDPAQAKEVLHMDDRVDALNREIYSLVRKEIRENPADVTYLLNCLLISRHLERIADHATNIAEEVIYMVEGEIVRHVQIDSH